MLLGYSPPLYGPTLQVVRLSPKAMNLESFLAFRSWVNDTCDRQEVPTIGRVGSQALPQSNSYN
jgi:hypothetical protein